MDGSAGSVGRIMAPLLGVPARAPRRVRATRPGVPADELHPRRARGHAARPRLPARRGPRAVRGRGGGPARRHRATPELRALLATEVRRARGAVRRGRAGDGGAPGVGPDRHPVRRRGLPARARPGRADRLRRARPAGRRARRGSCPAPHWGRCAGDAPGDAARRRADAAGGRGGPRRRADLRRELRRAGGRARAGRRRRRRARRRPLRDRRARRRRPAPPRRCGCEAMGVRDAIRQELPCMAFHTPHGSARFRLPWSWASFDYRTLCEELWAQCGDARFEIAKVEGRSGEAVRTDRGDIRATLVVDALGWRRVLGAGENVQPPDALISRGLEVHPDARGGDTDLDVWIDRSLVRYGYAWSVPADERAARRRRLLRAARTTSRSRRARSPGGSGCRRCATRATGSRTRCARRRRTACSSPATARATASRSRARGSARRSTSGSPAGASCGAVLGGRGDARRRARRLRGLLRRATPAPSGSRCGSSGSSRRSRRGCSRPRSAIVGRERLCRRAFTWYLEQAHPRAATGARSLSPASAGDLELPRARAATCRARSR